MLKMVSVTRNLKCWHMITVVENVVSIKVMTIYRIKIKSICCGMNEHE